VYETDLIRLFNRTNRKLRSVAAAVLAPYGVRLGQNLALEQLWATDGLTPGEIASRLEITGPTVVRMAQRMEERGLVTRRRDDPDGRLIRVYLTDRGRELQAPLESEFRRLDAQALAGLGSAQREQWGGFLRIMLANLDKYPLDPDDQGELELG
jgi:MarR family transcriptional regulator for hemolysin